MSYARALIVSISISLVMLASGPAYATGRLGFSETYRGSGTVDSLSVFSCGPTDYTFNTCIGMIYEERPLAAYDPYNTFIALDMAIGRNPQIYAGLGFDPAIALSQMIGSVFPFIPTADGYDVRYEIGVRAKFSNIGVGLSKVRVTPSTAAGSIYDSYQATVYLYF